MDNVFNGENDKNLFSFSTFTILKTLQWKKDCILNYEKMI